MYFLDLGVRGLKLVDLAHSVSDPEFPQLRRKYSIVGTFKFPPKKTIGNKVCHMEYPRWRLPLVSCVRCWSNLQSWSKVMVHLAFFDNFTIPSSPPINPPFPNTMLGHCAQSVPFEATFYGGKGGEPSLVEKSRFRHRTGGDDENKANFQGVPHTFDQDCSLPVSFDAAEQYSLALFLLANVRLTSNVIMG